MSTFLELCQDTARELSIPGTGPSSVLNQVGESADIVRWVKNAYIQIQNRHDSKWKFLRHGFTLDTVDAQDTYDYTAAIDSTTTAAIDRFSAWRINDLRIPPRIYLTASGIGNQTWLSHFYWDDFQSIYKISNQVDSFPAHITTNPQDEIVLGPKPNDVYTVTGEYYRSAQVLAADEDVPEMPVQFHELIVWYAIKRYGYREAASEVLSASIDYSKSYMRQLESNQLERFKKARPMA